MLHMLRYCFDPIFGMSTDKTLTNYLAALLTDRRCFIQQLKIQLQALWVRWDHP